MNPEATDWKLGELGELGSEGEEEEEEGVLTTFLSQTGFGRKK